VHLALQTDRATTTWSVELRKGARTRAEEEELVRSLVLNLVAEACGLSERLDLPWLEGERLETSGVIAPEAWRDLLLGRVDAVRHGGPTGQADRPSRAIFPGAFNPLHAAHRRMAQIAWEMLGVPVEFELAIVNVDKPPLDYQEMQGRTAQFAPEDVIWLTRTATFEEKSARFPGVTFVVGADTLARIADPRYYGGRPSACQAAVERIAARGCRFLVFGRAVEGRFLGLNDLDLPPTLRGLCSEVPGDRFRMNVSSSEIRKGQT